MTGRWTRFAGAGGVVAAVLFVTYVLMPPSTSVTASEFASSIGRNAHGLLLKNLIGELGSFFLLFFLGSLYNTLRGAEGGTGWLSLTFFGAGVAVMGVQSLETVADYALAWHVGKEGNLAVIRALLDIDGITAYYYAVPLAVMLLAASVVSYETRVLPRWLSWLGFVAGIVWLIGAIGVLDPQSGPLTAIGFGGGLLLFFILWLPATSIVLALRGGSTRPAPGAAAVEPA